MNSVFLKYGASQYYTIDTRVEILINRAIFTELMTRNAIQTSLRKCLALCVPGDNLWCSGSMLPVLPTFFNSEAVLNFRFFIKKT